MKIYHLLALILLFSSELFSHENTHPMASAGKDSHIVTISEISGLRGKEFHHDLISTAGNIRYNDHINSTSEEVPAADMEALAMPAGPLSIIFPELDLKKGENVCIPVTVRNFEDVASFSFALLWDPYVLRYESIENVHPELGKGGSQLAWNDDPIFSKAGQINFSWYDNAVTGIGIPDDEVLFEICFEVIGEPGEDTEIDLNEEGQTPIDFKNNAGEDIPFEIVKGKVTADSPGDPDEMYIVYCYTENSLEVEVFGGSSPYNYSLDGGGKGENVNGGSNRITIDWNSDFTPGSYTLEIEDNTGVFHTETVEIKAFRNPAADPSPNICNSEEPNGSVAISNLPADGNYKVEWEYEGRKSYRDSLMNIRGGAISYTVKFGDQCPVSGSTEVEDEGLKAEYTIVSEPSCGGSPGSAEITVEGGVGPYTYNHPKGTTNSGSPLEIDIHGARTEVNIKDSRGCAVNLTVESSISGGAGITLVDETITEINCSTSASSKGQFHGRLETTGTIRKKELYFSDSSTMVPGTQWNFTGRPLEELRAIGLEGGNYEWRVTGDCGIDTFRFTIQDFNETPIQLDPEITAVGCSSDGKGAISLSVFPESGNYEFSWTDHSGAAFSSTKDISGLEVGEYTVEVRNLDTRCETTETWTITEGVVYDKTEDIFDCEDPQPLTVGVTIREDYESIVWDTGEETELITVEEGGYYYFTITPADPACGAVRDSIFISSSVGGIGIRSLETLTINECDQRGQVTIQLKEIPLSEVEFSWDDGDRIPGTEMDANTYRFTGEDIHTVKVYKDDCLAVDTFFNIEFKGAIKILDTSHLDISCFGQTDGRIEVQATGGRTGDLSFYLVEADIENVSGTFSRLAAGDYTVMVRDEAPSSFSPCKAIPLSFTLTEPDSLSVAVDSSSVIKPGCEGMSNGLFVLQVNGGNDGAWDIRYSYPGGADRTNELTLDNLRAGEYQIRLTDERGCSANTRYYLAEPEPIIFSIPPVPEAECHGEAVSFTIPSSSISGGTGSSYQYSVDGGVSMPADDETSVLAGSHNVVVYDGSGCESENFFTVYEPNPIIVTFDKPDTLEASLGEDVDISAQVDGDYAIREYIWSPGGADSLAIDGNLRFTAVDDIIITLDVFDTNNCPGSGQIYVLVRKKRDMGIPNAFSPNGDGFNDIYTVFPSPSVKMIKAFQIYDRYGALVWEAKNIRPDEAQITGWDGTYSGTSAMSDVYVVVVEVEYIDSQVIRWVNDITLIR